MTTDFLIIKAKRVDVSPFFCERQRVSRGMGEKLIKFGYL